MLPLLRQAPPRRWSRADRFHLLQNLGQALQGCLARHLATRRKTHIHKTREEHLPIGEAPCPMRRSPQVECLQQAYREERLARYAQVVAVRKLAMSPAALAERVGIGQSPVSNWLALGRYPETTRGPYGSRLDPYLPWLFQRWESGCHTMVRLHQELVARGGKRVLR